MAFAETLPAFFAEDDFAVAAVVGGVSVSVIFDRAHTDDMGIGGTQPTALIQSTDVAARAITRNSAMLIAGSTYYVQNVLPDGTGITMLLLSLEPA